MESAVFVNFEAHQFPKGFAARQTIPINTVLRGRTVRTDTIVIADRITDSAGASSGGKASAP
jgi:hypothetical protein